jgi:hypothetical protein
LHALLITSVSTHFPQLSRVKVGDSYRDDDTNVTHKTHVPDLDNAPDQHHVVRVVAWATVPMERKMAVSARVQVLNDVFYEEENGGWQLHFQHVRFVYDDGSLKGGYRFIWKRPDGTLQAARGQARIPSFKIAQDLMKKAAKAGWGDFDYESSPDE